MPKPLTITERFSTFTPIVCRLLARRVTATGAVIALTDEEIAAGSGGRFSVPQVAKLSRRVVWGDTPVDSIMAFVNACGINLEDRDSLKHHLRYMRNIKGTPRYLIKSPLYKDTFLPLLSIWEKHRLERSESDMRG